MKSILLNIFFLSFLMLVSGESIAMLNLYSFSSERWVTINDSVMGGISTSKMSYDQNNDTLKFSGKVSLENNGGFASTRSLIDLPSNLIKAKVKIRVSGDGKIYQLRFRTEQYFDAIAYAAVFQTNNGEISEHEFSLQDFIPVFRGRRLSNVPELSWQNLTQIGFMISNKQEGEFSLKIYSIEWIE